MNHSRGGVPAIKQNGGISADLVLRVGGWQDYYPLLFRVPQGMATPYIDIVMSEQTLYEGSIDDGC